MNTNVYNWYTKLGLVCNPNRKNVMSTVGMLALIGVGVSCLFVPRLGDLYGRKPVFIAALTL